MAQLKDTTISGDIEVTGSLNLDGVINLASNNTGRIYGVGTDGTVRDAFCPYDTADNLILGYGGYLDAVGQTNIYGNEVEFFANGGTIESNVPFRNHMYMCYRSSSLGSRSHTASYKPLSIDTMLADTSLGLFSSGSYTVNGVTYTGIKCNKDGMVLAWASCYNSGLTAYDTVGCCIYKNNVQYGGSRVSATKANVSALSPLRPFSVSEGDVLLLGCCNFTAARGAAESGSSTLLGAMYVR